MCVHVSEASAGLPRPAAGSSQAKRGNLLDRSRKRVSCPKGFFGTFGFRGERSAVFGAGKEPFCCGRSGGAGNVEVRKEHPHPSGLWELLALG